MSASLTQYGLAAALLGTATPNGGIANLATAIRLYTNATSPAKDGTGFTEASNGNGYTTGGIAISRGDWTGSWDGTNYNLQLTNKTWTASGGSIANVAGAYIVDVGNNVLAWWDHASGAFTQTAPDQIIADTLIIRGT